MSFTTIKGEELPGRFGEVDGIAVMNKKRRTAGAWDVVIGSRYYPDYVIPNTGGRAGGGGQHLTPDEAEELAAVLISVAAWARAQNALTSES